MAFRDEFPVLEQLAYLNAGTDGPIPRAAAEAARAELDAQVGEGRLYSHFMRRHELAEQLREGYARVMHCAPGQVAVTSGTSAGLGAVLAGLDIGPGYGTGRELSERLLERGVLVKDTHGRTVRLAPPLMVAKEDLAAIRTGRAHPAMFNKILADYYGTKTPINQLASFSVPEARMAVVTPFDKSALRNIEQAIRDSDLGVNPTNDGQVLRVTIPQLTEERRKVMVKLAKSKGEDGKIAVRNIRRKGMDSLKKLQKDGDAGEDEVNAGEKDLDKVTNDYVSRIDDLVASKEEELMEV